MRASATDLLTGHPQRAVVVLGDLNDEVEAATTQILRRALILYLFGIFTYEGVAKGWENVRLLGVLQRIAICYLITALAFVYLKPKALVALCASLLVGYWALMTFVPVPEFGAGNFAEGKNLANYIDKHYLSLFKWDGDHDPEGLLSTLPAIASCLLGVFAGLWLRRTDVDDRRKVTMLFALSASSVVTVMPFSPKDSAYFA